MIAQTIVTIVATGMTLIALARAAHLARRRPIAIKPVAVKAERRR
jgi:hypothetical protein